MIANTEKTSKIPVFGGSRVYLVIFGFVIMAFRSNLEKFDLYIYIFLKDLVKFVFGAFIILVFEAIEWI